MRCVRVQAVRLVMRLQQDADRNVSLALNANAIALVCVTGVSILVLELAAMAPCAVYLTTRPYVGVHKVQLGTHS